MKFRMLRVLSLIAIVFLFKIDFADAQIIFPRIGTTISTVNYKPAGSTVDVSPRLSVVVGIGAEFKVAEHWHVAGEVSYVGRDYKMYFDVETIPTQRYRYDVVYHRPFVDVPLQVKRYFELSPVKVYFSLGGYVGFGMQGTVKGEQGEYNPSSQDRMFGPVRGKIIYAEQPVWNTGYDVYYENKVDYGLLVGGGVVLFQALMLDVRYGAGFVDLQEDMGDYKNRIVQLSLAVPLKFSPMD